MNHALLTALLNGPTAESVREPAGTRGEPRGYKPRQFSRLERMAAVEKVIVERANGATCEEISVALDIGTHYARKMCRLLGQQKRVIGGRVPGAQTWKYFPAGTDIKGLVAVQPKRSAA